MAGAKPFKSITLPLAGTDLPSDHPPGGRDPVNEIPGEPIADPVPLRWWLGEVERAFETRGSVLGLRTGQRLDPGRATVHRVSREGRAYSVAWVEFRSWFPEGDEALDFLCPGGSTTVLFRDARGTAIATFAEIGRAHV